MAAPQVTPLLLLSELSAWTGQSATLSPVETRRAIVRASDYLQRLCGKRRFDERVETVYYTAQLESLGGDLGDPHQLRLRDDLKTVSSLAHGVRRYVGDMDEGTAITSGYMLLRESKTHNIAYYDLIQLDPSGELIWAGEATDPTKSIKVAGLWGYGGQWVDTGTTLSADVNGTQTSIAISSPTNLEIGMTHKVDAEYWYHDEGTSSPITVARAFNGSTAATHSSGATIYRWQALDVVQELIIRLMQWRQAQQKAPLFGQVVVGDITFPVDTNGTPRDVLDTIQSNRLRRKKEHQAA